MINAAALRHPRTQWEIEAALWRATQDSANQSHGIGYAEACAASGRVIVSVRHDRYAVPALSFWSELADVTDKVLPVLRAQK
jgi:hypothetical protein